MRIVAIIQARLGSTRFPRKVLADLHGKPVLQHVIERVRAVKAVEVVAIATVWGNEELAAVAKRGGASATHFVDRAENDVLGRYQDCAEIWDDEGNVDAVIRITGDCPLIDPRVIQRVLWLFDESDLDFASNDTRVSGYPDGWDVEVFSRELLERADRSATDPSDREHVTPWMRRHGRCGILYAPDPWTGPKLSIDTPEDLQTVRRWMEDHPA